MKSTIPSQCKICMNFNIEESLCQIHEQLPGEYGRENIKDCPSFLEKGTKEADDLNLLMSYIDEDENSQIVDTATRAVEKILSDYQSKYKVLIVGIARRKIKSIIKMVDIVDSILDRLGDQESLRTMTSSQSIRLLSELNHSMNNDLAFIMKLVNPDTKLADLQLWIDARSVNINSGSSTATDMKADEILRVSESSRDKIRDAFDALLHQLHSEEDTINIIEKEDVEDEG